MAPSLLIPCSSHIAQPKRLRPLPKPEAKMSSVGGIRVTAGDLW